MVEIEGVHFWVGWSSFVQPTFLICKSDEVLFFFPPTNELINAAKALRSEVEVLKEIGEEVISTFILPSKRKGTDQNIISQHLRTVAGLVEPFELPAIGVWNIAEFECEVLEDGWRIKVDIGVATLGLGGAACLVQRSEGDETG